MADVFDEISDDLRHQRLLQFWKENGSWVIGGVIATIIMTGALSMWRQYEYSRNGKATAELMRVAREPDPVELETFANSTDKKHAALARFLAASVHIDMGEQNEAVALYNKIGDTRGLDRTYRELAKLLSVSQRMEKGEPASLKKELAALSKDNAPWRYTALELSALLSARQGNLPEAVELLTKITADPLSPGEARARAFTLRELYIAEGK